jgi:hypothetical protein
MSNEMEAPLQEIGSLMVEAASGNPEGAFLYAEVEPGMTAWGLFIDRGGYVEYLVTDHRLVDAIVALWRVAPPDKKWGGLSYAIAQGSLDAQFHYPDSWDEDEIYDDRRERILIARYGEKPIKYPPPPPEATQL